MARRRPQHLRPRGPIVGIQPNRLVAVGVIAAAVVLLAIGMTAVTRRGDERLDVVGGAGRTAETAPTGAAAAAPSSAAATSGVAESRGRRGSGQTVTLAFGGDVHFEGQIRTRLQADPASVMEGVAPLLSRADLAVINLETAITARGTKAPDKEFTFRAPPAAFAALRAGGVDVASMANNHGMDYGREGLEDSLDAAAAGGVAVVGIGRNATEAFRPFISEVRGQRIGVIGATQVLDDDLRAAWTATDSQPGLASAKEVDRLTAAVRATRAQVDTLVVYLHWGTEGRTCPNEVQPILARALTEAGADVIVGGHAHRLQGAGRLGAAFVAYGLGNFVFYADDGPGTDSGVLTVTVTGRDIDGYRWTPARLVGGRPAPLSGTAADQASKAWAALRDCARLTP